MKTKPITLILTLLFCLSGSVFAEEENKNEPVNGNLHKYKKNKYRVNRFREIIDLSSFTPNRFDSLDDLIDNLPEIKLMIDLGKVWSYEDTLVANRKYHAGLLKKGITVSNPPNIRKPFTYYQVRFKPLNIYKNLIHYETLDNRYAQGRIGNKVFRNVKTELMIHPNPKIFKIGKEYAAYLPYTPISAEYFSENDKGVKILIKKRMFQYGTPITEAEYYKQFNADKDEN